MVLCDGGLGVCVDVYLSAAGCLAAGAVDHPRPPPNMTNRRAHPTPTPQQVPKEYMACGLGAVVFLFLLFSNGAGFLWCVWFWVVWVGGGRGGVCMRMRRISVARALARLHGVLCSHTHVCQRMRQQRDRLPLPGLLLVQGDREPQQGGRQAVVSACVRCVYVRVSWCGTVPLAPTASGNTYIWT